jgi:hypothetical protein
MNYIHEFYSVEGNPESALCCHSFERPRAAHENIFIGSVNKYYSTEDFRSTGEMYHVCHVILSGVITGVDRLVY